MFFIILIGLWIVLQMAINKERKDPRHDKITIVEKTTVHESKNIDIKIQSNTKFIR